MQTITSQPTIPPERLQSFTMPAVYNGIQSALYQLERGNSEAAIAFLKSAQGCLIRSGFKWEA